MINKGRMTALDSPKVRALSSRYGDPKELLAEDWLLQIPGINAPGKYADYARGPWKTVSIIFQKVENGT